MDWDESNSAFEELISFHLFDVEAWWGRGSTRAIESEKNGLYS